jgi:phenylalanyl-tRNA synthetase beta chain
MKISYLWLLDCIDLQASPHELRDALSGVGLVVEGVQPAGDDTVLDVEIPSNRPDCLSHIGIARELAAIYDCDLKVTPAKNPEGEGNFPITIEDPKLCRRYSGRVIRGVKITDSPAWIKKRLVAVGQRPINNIVDITNYVLLEMGHPLHAFDLAKLQGPEVIVRHARLGEKLRTLDGMERNLDPERLVIADARDPVALAGVMGGESSEISAASRDLLIESAYFDPGSICRTARHFQMRTEASHRFERGADLQATVPALERCVELILKFAGGSAETKLIDVFPAPLFPPSIALRQERLKLYSVTEVPAQFVERTLARLGFRTEAKDREWTVRPPSHRVDISEEEDLIEEVLRHYGYEKIPSSMPAWKGKGDFLPETEQRLKIAELLRSLGYSETLNWTFIDPDLQASFGYHELPVVLKNPMSTEASQLRTHLAPNLVMTARHNQNHGQERMRLFEIGKTFARQGPEIREKEHVAWVAMGAETRKYWHPEIDPPNYFYMKGVLESLLRGAVLKTPELRSAGARFLNPAQSAEIHVNGECVGYVGSLHPRLQDSLKIKEDLFLGEFDLSALGRSSAGDGVSPVVQSQPAATSTRLALYQPVSRYPGVFRDFSFLVDRKVPFASLMDFISNHPVPNLKRVELIDLYQSEQLPAGKISLAIRLYFESAERTLTDDEVESARDQVVSGLKKEFGVIPR